MGILNRSSERIPRSLLQGTLQSLGESQINPNFSSGAEKSR
jgi:hypothetical protein